MSPSLFTLFKRGKYYHRSSPLADGPNEEKGPKTTTSERREAERFAVAAVAFCLQHDTNFRQHFWRAICKHDGDPKLNGTAKVEVEENRWDLTISNGKVCYLLEFKIDCDLAAKQNPNEPAFMQIGGYGHAMKSLARVCRYVVLGFKEPLGLRNGRQLTDWLFCSERPWAALSDGFNSSGNRLINDLFDCLAKLRISHFQIMNAQKIKVSEKISTVCEAFSVLKGVGTALDLKRRPQSNRDEEGYWWIGEDIRRHQGSKNSELLNSLTGQKSGLVGWFGFQGKDGTPERALWLYCKSKSEAVHAKELLGRAADDPDPDKHHGWNVKIIEKIRGGTNDFGWFIKQFQKLGLETAK
jgi:hypothetical protein